jgi:N-formylglutamate deformylase
MLFPDSNNTHEAMHIPNTHPWTIAEGKLHACLTPDGLPAASCILWRQRKILLVSHAEGVHIRHGIKLDGAITWFTDDPAELLMPPAYLRDNEELLVEVARGSITLSVEEPVHGTRVFSLLPPPDESPVDMGPEDVRVVELSGTEKLLAERGIKFEYVDKSGSATVHSSPAKENAEPALAALILHIPHAATAIPFRDGFLFDTEALRAEQLLLADWHTDDLFANPQDVAVIAPFSRLFCDVERFADDAQEVMAQYGMGVCYTHSDAGSLMRQVDPALRKRILRTHYQPHHDRLTAAVQAQLDRHGSATLIDCHSYPGSPLLRDLDQHPQRPQFNIGTDPFHTPAELVDQAVAYFRSRGCSVEVDRPYRGTLVPMPYYQKDKCVRSLMLEVNRDLYLEPGSSTRSAGYARVKELVQGFLEVVRKAAHTAGDPLLATRKNSAH